MIDVQNEYLTGALPIAHPDPAVSLAAIGQAMDAATAAGVPVVVVQHTEAASAPVFAEGGHGWQLHEPVARRPRDLLLRKAEASCFAGTELARWLTERGIDTITITGYMTQHCDEATARDGEQRGLSVEFLADATGTPGLSNEAGTVDARTLHEAVLVTMQSGFAAVGTTDEWLAAVREGRALRGSDVRTAAARAGEADPPGVRQLRLVVATDDFDAALAFYRDTLGLPSEAAFTGAGGARVAILDAGRATLELANPEQVAMIDGVEADGRPSDRLRVGFQVADARATTARLVEAGAELIAEARETPWRSLNSRLRGPAGLQLTLFEQLDE